MELSDYINADNLYLNKVNIVDQTEDSYTVEYGDRTVVVSRADETKFELGENRQNRPLTSYGGLVQVMVMKQDIVRSTEFSQEDDVPDEYKEIMIFHELREAEYRESGFEDAHQRAVNDEVLYALKFMDRETREGYFDFANGYRRAEKLADTLVDRIVAGIGEGPDPILYFLTDQDKKVYNTLEDFCVDSWFPEWILRELVYNNELRALYEDNGIVDPKILSRAGRRLINDEEMVTRITERVFPKFHDERYTFREQKVSGDIEQALVHVFQYGLDEQIWSDWRDDEIQTIDDFFEYVRKGDDGRSTFLGPPSF